MVLCQPATPQQSFWLGTTRVPLRSIGFVPPVFIALGRPAAPELTAVRVTVSPYTLEASARTLEVEFHSASRFHAHEVFNSDLAPCCMSCSRLPPSCTARLGSCRVAHLVRPQQSS